MRLPVPLFALAALVAGAASAQPLATLAPADTVLALSLTPTESPLDGLGDDLAALDWEGAAATIAGLMTALGEGPGGDLPMRGDAAELFAELEEACPDAAEVGEGLELLRPGDAYLLTVSVSPFNPMPAVTALARVGDAEGAAALQDALIACFGTGATYREGEIDLHLLGDGGDLPVVVARLDDLFLVGTQPEVARGVLRLAQGGDEPSLADGAIGRALGPLGAGGAAVALDVGALADLAQFYGLAVQNVSDDDPVGRALAALRTVGAVAARVGLEPEGMVLESVLAVDPEGGDAALADLLGCRGCGVGRPFLAPADAVSASSQAFPVRGWVAYLEGWLETVDVDLRATLAEEVGLDLDTALLDWIGEELHTVVLEPLGTELGTLLGGPAQATFLPVADPDAARAGLRELGAALEPFAADLLRSMGGVDAALEGALGGGVFGATPDLDGGPLGSGRGFALRSRDYRGVEIHRLQAGFNVDLGVAVIGNHLAFGSPAAALEPLVDVYRGAPGLVGTARWRAFMDTVPAGATAFALDDVGATLRGAAATLDVAAQPLTAALELALFTTIVEREESGGDVAFSGSTDLAGVRPEPLPPGGLEGALEPQERSGEGGVSDHYALEGLEPGQEVAIELTSEAFDTYLFLYDADTGRYLRENDDAPDTTRSELRFRVEAGTRYGLEVSSYLGDEVGPYRLTVEAGPRAEEAGPAPAPPSFGELLEVAELLPDALRVLADHVGVRRSVTVQDGDLVVSRTVVPVRW